MVFCDKREKLRGSSDIPGAVDIEFALNKKGDCLTLESVKTRIEPVGPIRLKIKTDQGFQIVSLGEAPSKTEEIKEGILSISAIHGEAGFDRITEDLRAKGIESGKNQIRDTIATLVLDSVLVCRTAEHNKKFYSLNSNHGSQMADR